MLAHDRQPFTGDVSLVPLLDRGTGAIARLHGASTVRRAEPGPHGPMLLEATVNGGVLEGTVWGSSATPQMHVDQMMDALRGWVGHFDRPEELNELVAGHAPLRRALRELGEVRMSRLPRVFEALSRAIVGQLVQRTEAVRSVAQVARRFGEAAPGNVVTWPHAQSLGAIPAWELRRCGISLRGARSLHAAAVHDAGLQQAATSSSVEATLAPRMAALDSRLRTLPGVGVWTSAETRLALGDPDAVSVGDYNLHAWITHALARVPAHASSDALMLELLAPFAPQRGRVILLIVRAFQRGLLPRPGRVAPHARLSEHRYW